MYPKKLYTIGYAGKTLTQFVDLCKAYGINCIVDVRTSPFSGHFPDFNENRLKSYLKDEGIQYLSFKNEFGARRIEPEAYSRVTMDSGDEIEVVDFEKVYSLPIFKDGVDRIERGVEKGYRIAFLCSEKDAADCHRSIMVACYFDRLGYEIENIIDSSVGSYGREGLLNRLRSNFADSAAHFKRKNGFDSFESTQGSLLEGPSFEEPKFVDEWKNFYRFYTPEKAIRLRNYQIGFKKGQQGNG